MAFIPSYLHLRYLPLKPGNYWELRSERPEELVIKVEVMDRQNLPSGIMYRLKYSIEDEIIMVENLIVDHRGIWIHSRLIEGTMLMYDPIFLLLPSNFKELKWWNWQGTIGTVEAKSTIIYEGNTVVDLEEEAIPCIKLKFTEENKYGTSTYIRYYGEHLGLVKEIADSVHYSYEAIVESAEVEYDDYSYIEEVKKLIEQFEEEEEKPESEELPEDLGLEEDLEEEPQEYDETELVEDEEFIEELQGEELEELEEEELEELDDLEELEGLDDLDELPDTLILDDEENEDERG